MKPANVLCVFLCKSVTKCKIGMIIKQRFILFRLFSRAESGHCFRINGYGYDYKMAEGDRSTLDVMLVAIGL